MSYRRHLMMHNPGGAVLPAWFTEHIVCWYSPKRQGCTNESMAADPTLKDLSGNGRNLPLEGFLWTETSGIDADGALSMGNDTETSVSDWTYSFADGFTCISKHKAITNNEDFKNLWEFCNIGDSWENTIFINTQSGNIGQICSYGNWKSNKAPLVSTSMISIYATSSTYCRFYIGSSITTANIVRGNVRGARSLLLHTLRDSALSNNFKVKLYEMLLFDCDLTSEQMDWIKNNLLE